MLDLPEEPHRDVPLVGGRPPHARNVGPVQPGDHRQRVGGQGDGDEEAHDGSVHREPAGPVIGVIVAARATLIPRDR
jgi:hypothetical protein